MIKVKMMPNLEQAGYQANGISRVIENYYRYLPKFGIEIVEDGSHDLRAVHAGMTGKECDVAHLHGMYFTADYDASKAEYAMNANIVEAVRSAKIITVPSSWVAEIFQRDLRVNPVVVPHGIDWKSWAHNEKHEEYVLWAKNRNTDVCNPNPIGKLARMAPDVRFVSTFAPTEVQAKNISVIGPKPASAIKPFIQRAGIYTSLVKETFGIATLEAMASGCPILGFDFGGNRDIVKHGVNGYLAKPYDYDDLLAGLEYCMANRTILGQNSVELAKLWTWEKAVEILAGVYQDALDITSKTKDDSVSVIIPVYNYASKVGRAIESVLNQSTPPKEIIVVDDGSTDNCSDVVKKYLHDDRSKVKYVYQNNSGLALEASG